MKTRMIRFRRLAWDAARFTAAALALIAARVARAVRQVLSDTDTYVFGGMWLIFAGVGFAWSFAVAAIVLGVLVLGYGVWMLPSPPSRSREDD